MVKFSICRDTLFQHLRRHKVPLRFKPKLGPEGIAEAVEAYKGGCSLATIANHLEVSPATVKEALLGAGISIRPRRGYEPTQ